MLAGSQQLYVPITSFECNGNIYLQSTSYFNGIPNFLVIIMESLKFETFHCGVKIYVPTLSKNRITKIDRWSAIDEVLRYLHSRESDEKLTVLKEQIAAMSGAPVGKKLYSPEIMVRASEYYSTSRALYTRLKEDLKLPSIPTLSRLTSRVSKISDSNFINRVFESLFVLSFLMRYM